MEVSPWLWFCVFAQLKTHITTVSSIAEVTITNPHVVGALFRNFSAVDLIGVFLGNRLCHKIKRKWEAALSSGSAFEKLYLQEYKRYLSALCVVQIQ